MPSVVGYFLVFVIHRFYVTRDVGDANRRAKLAVKHVLNACSRGFACNFLVVVFFRRFFFFVPIARLIHLVVLQKGSSTFTIWNERTGSNIENATTASAGISVVGIKNWRNAGE